jgi:hypothetical protein
MMAGRGAYISLSEYEVLDKLGRPPHVMMSKRTEKSYVYPVCDSTVAVVLRFTGTGRVKEMYWEAAENE